MYVVSSEFSKVYEIGGSASHLAARLEAAAEPGEVYVSEACRNLSEGYFRFQSLGSKALKGFAASVAVYRVIGASDLSMWGVRRMRSVSRFVGRCSEMALLRHVAQATLAKGATVIVTGDPGVGKSRLVHEFAYELETVGWRLIEANGSPNLQGAPFALLKELLQSLLDAAMPDTAKAEYVDPRASLTPILQSAVDTVLDVLESDDEWQRLEPQARGRAISDASCALAENVASRQRTAILIEDVHWVDRASATTVAALAALQSSNLLVLVTSRSNGSPSWLWHCNAEILALRPLDDGASRAMLDDILGLSSTTYELKARIIRHTANVPLFIEEVCRRLKETGILIGPWGEATLHQPVEALGIPASVQGVIAARLDRLTRLERSVVQTVAALGPRSKIATLRGVVALSASLFDSSLDALERAEILARVKATTEETLEFPHDMIRQVAYDSMLGPAREDLHARILSTLEGEEDSRQEVERLCYHATRGKAWGKTFDYGRNVARRCVARSAFADATSYYEIAIEALDKLPYSRAREIEAIDLRTEARLAFMGFGKVAEWFDLGKEAESRASAIDDLGRKVAAMAVRASAQNFYGTPIEAIATSEQVVELAQKWGDPGLLSLAEYGLGQAYFTAGRYLEADRMLARERAQLLGPHPVAPIGTTVEHMLVMCCMLGSVVNTNLGNRENADRLRRRSREMADRSGRPFDRVVAALGDAAFLLDRGDFSAGANILDEASELAERHGVRMFIPAVGCYRGIAYLEAGRLDEAKEILAAARESSKAIGYKSMELRASVHLARLLGRAGAAGEAQNILRFTTNTAAQEGFSGIEAEAMLFQATIIPVTDDKSRTAIVRHLRASIAISLRNGAKPLALKAEALLNGIVAGKPGVPIG